MPPPSKRALALQRGNDPPAQRDSKAADSFLQKLVPDPARQQEERQANDKFNQGIDQQRRLLVETHTRLEQSEVEQASASKSENLCCKSRSSQEETGSAENRL